LAEWCVEHGATEFSLAFLVAGDVQPSSFASIDAALAPFRLDDRDDRFVLTVNSLATLKALFPDGLLGNLIQHDAWVEDPTFYRSGVPLLQVVSHEGEAVLTIDPTEQTSLDRLALPYHHRGVWV
jgi:hypothetical protein